VVSRRGRVRWLPRSDTRGILEFDSADGHRESPRGPPAPRGRRHPVGVRSIGTAFQDALRQEVRTEGHCLPSIARDITARLPGGAPNDFAYLGAAIFRLHTEGEGAAGPRETTTVRRSSLVAVLHLASRLRGRAESSRPGLALPGPGRTTAPRDRSFRHGPPRRGGGSTDRTIADRRRCRSIPTCDPILSLLARGLVLATSSFTGAEDRTRAGNLSPPSNPTWDHRCVDRE
jgi:hypothetical protein